MIVTGKTRVPWRWVILMTIPWFALRLGTAVTQTLLPFTLRKFTADPALITFLISTDTMISIIIGPLVAWKSDRIWTRIGRRKPFIVASMVGSAMFLPILPFTSSLLLLAIAMTGFNFFNDIVIYEPLFMEVIPPPQRGRASSIRQGTILGAGIYFNMMLFGNFDAVTGFEVAGRMFSLTGEAVAYLTIAAVLLSAGLLVLFSTKEIRPLNAPSTSERFSLRLLLGNLFGDKQLLKIYSLLFAIMAMTFGLAGLAPLLLTEQFGYSKMVTAKMWTTLQIIQFIVALPIAGFLSDRVDRLKLFLIGIIVSTCFPITYWSYIHFIAPNNIPSIPAIMFFTGADYIVDFTTNIAIMPLVYDYMPRARMGTLFGGMALVRGTMRLILANTMGNFVKYYSRIFCEKGVIDYSSGYLLVFIFGLMGIGCAIYFLRERAAGRVIPYGQIEHDTALRAQKQDEETQPPSSVDKG